MELGSLPLAEELQYKENSDVQREGERNLKTKQQPMIRMPNKEQCFSHTVILPMYWFQTA